jgi:transposase
MSRSWWTIIQAGWCGLLPAATAGRSFGFLTRSGKSVANRSNWVSADMAAWISGPIVERIPDAIRCVDPFHVVMLATNALDEVRREV